MSAEENDPKDAPMPDEATAEIPAVMTEEVPMEEPIPAPAPPFEEEPGFDLIGVDNPSFAMLQEGQADVFLSPSRVRGLARRVAELSDTGEEGRRKGLGLWMLGEYDACEKQLAKYDKDDVASFTRAQALMSLGRFDDAAPIFQRLSDAYPDEPRPRGGRLGALLESELAKLDDPTDVAQTTPVADRLAKELESAPAAFHESAEGHFLAGRIAELRGDPETALDHYTEGAEADSSLKELLARAGELAESVGLDDEAIDFYELLLPQRPVNRRVLLNLGVLYEDAGRDQEAAACYDVVVRNCPTDARARLYLEDAKAGMNMYYDEDLERKEDRLNQILRIPITDFELSVRARNCLNKMQIATLGDLVCRTEQELLSYKNFGETSLTEIKEILHSKGLRLGMPREEAVASIEAHAHRPASGDQADVMNKPIMELQLSIRARRTVEALGCLTAGDITKHSAEELLGMPNFGQTSLQELRSTLGDLSLKLKGE